MNYFQHFLRNLRRSGRAELPCVGSIETVEGSTAAYLGSIPTVAFGVGAAGLFIGWERYGEELLGGEHRPNNNVSYKSNPMKALIYDVKSAFSYDIPRIGKALYVAPLHIVKTIVKCGWKERREVLRDMVRTGKTGMIAELLAYIPASVVVERLIPVEKELGHRDWEYWLLWPAALVAGWALGTIGIAVKLGWDDFREERRREI